MSSAKRRFLLLATLVLAVIVYVLIQRTPQWQFWRTSDEGNALLVSGNIEAHESVLSFQSIQSRITELPFEEGRWVQKGSKLASVDATDYLQQVHLAEAALTLQSRQVDIAQQNLVTAQRTLDVDQAALRQRELDYRRAQDLQRQGFVSSAN